MSTVLGCVFERRVRPADTTACALTARDHHELNKQRARVFSSHAPAAAPSPQRRVRREARRGFPQPGRGFARRAAGMPARDLSEGLHAARSIASPSLLGRTAPLDQLPALPSRR